MARRALTVALLVLAALAAGGCGVGAGESEREGATLTVTRDFGARVLLQRQAAEVPGGETVMRFLQRNTDVETGYGGRFVDAIASVRSGRARGEQRDWFYYVNGIEASEGAVERDLAGGDRVWWDYRDWSAAMRVPAVVGSFPEPFLSGVEGKRLPVRLDCAQAAQGPCDEVAERLGAAGVKAGRSAAGGFGGEGLLRIKVGVWADLRRDAAVRRLEEGPQVSGVYARPTAAGDALALLDAEGAAVRTLGPGSGLVAATKLAGEAPTWVVTGTDAVGLAAAAAQLGRDALADRFAIAVEDGRPVSLPVLPSPEAP